MRDMEELQARVNYPAIYPAARKLTPNKVARAEAKGYLEVAKDLISKGNANGATAAATVALAIMAVEIVN